MQQKAVGKSISSAKSSERDLNELRGCAGSPGFKIQVCKTPGRVLLTCSCGGIARILR